MRSKQAWFSALMFAGLVMLCGCPPAGGSGGSINNNGGSSTEVATEAGMDFHRKDVGVPITTLDYIGESPSGLASARDTGQVFFAVQGQSEDELYVRDTSTLERRFLGQVPNMQQGSLAATADGKYLVYCRQRDRETYVDNPRISYPKKIAMVVRREVATGLDESLFDFKTDPFLMYRNNQLTPVPSRDGSFIAVVSYNMNRLSMARMLSDWLAIEADLRERSAEFSEEEKVETTGKLRQLLLSDAVTEYFSENGLEAAEEGAPTEAERQGMEDFFNNQRSLETVLLLWDNGESRILPLTLPEEFNDSLIFLVAVERDTVVVWPQPIVPDLATPNQFFKVDLESGELTEICSFIGTPSTFELTGDAKALQVLYNKVDLEAREIVTETTRLTCPLDGGETSEVSLQGDYLGYVDLVQDGRFAVGQDQDNNSIVLCDIDGSQEYVQLELPGKISGISLDSELKHAVFIDAGVLYAIPLSQTPEQVEGYVNAAYFDQFQAKFSSFLSNLGFTGVDEISGQYEERWGLKTHEVSIQFYNPTEPDKLCLMRYSVLDDQVVAAWFPHGYMFPRADATESSGELDYYECKDIADQSLDALDWLNAETRAVYQPGSNPLYDGRTSSYILLYRDGYWLDEEAKDKWVINREATVRINSRTGEIAELSLSQTDPILDQEFEITPERALFFIRNEGEMPIPEDAPVRFDTENVRYVIDMADETFYGPAEYELGHEQRICYEIDAYIQPEDELIATYRVDTQTGAVLGQLDFQPSSLAGLMGGGGM